MCGKIPIKEFNHWKIVNNRFPYDLIAKVHHILIPKRHVIEKELTEEEFKEFVYIKESYVSKEGYHWILEATGKSFPGHFHVHLITRHDKLV